jgi:hypothetical protein
MAGIWRPLAIVWSAILLRVRTSLLIGAFAGGRKMPNGSVSRNITSDPEDGLGKWTDERIKVAVTDGKRPDGTALNRIMAFDWYKGITQPDLDSIVAYLRTIPPQKTP